MQTPTSIHRTDLLAAVEVAIRAPSLHNTQPWRWRLLPDGLELHADRSRQLPGTDPDGHGLTVSCGAALELARLALVSAGWVTEVTLLPDGDGAERLARLRVRAHVAPAAEDAALVEAALRRRTNRFPFDPRPVEDSVVDGLLGASDSDDVWLHPLREGDELIELIVLTSHADEAERQDADYRTELQQWTNRDDSESGVPASAVPHIDSAAERETAIVVRDFEMGVRGERTAPPGPVERPAVLVLLTIDDSAHSWLRAGQTLMRVLVKAEVAGLATLPFTQPVDWPGRRSQLRTQMNWVGHPQFLLRVGYPGETATTAPTPRRSVDEVLLPDEPAGGAPPAG